MYRREIIDILTRDYKRDTVLIQYRFCDKVATSPFAMPKIQAIEHNSLISTHTLTFVDATID